MVEGIDFSVTYRSVEPTSNPNPVGDARTFYVRFELE